MNTKNLATERIPISKLVPAEVQNSARETVAGLRDLITDLSTYGQLAPIHVQRMPGNKYKVADGHRRWTAAKELGWSSLTATIHSDKIPATTLYAVLNGATRGFRGADWFYSWAQLKNAGQEELAAEFLTTMPKHTASHIVGCVKLFGAKRAAEIASIDKVSPTIQSFVPCVHGCLLAKLQTDMRLRPAQIGEWLVKHGSAIRKLINSNPTLAQAKKLHTRIRRDEPFPSSEWG